jgi:hypothetical protein
MVGKRKRDGAKSTAQKEEPAPVWGLALSRLQCEPEEPTQMGGMALLGFGVGYRLWRSNSSFHEPQLDNKKVTTEDEFRQVQQVDGACISSLPAR